MTCITALNNEKFVCSGVERGEEYVEGDNN
jgi:hypothetical protein